jgi:thioredoxin 1
MLKDSSHTSTLENIKFPASSNLIEIKGVKMSAGKVTVDNFDEIVLKSSKPVLVDFWAEWCGPCRAVGPILDEISNEYGDKLTIVKLNTDEESALAIKYGVTSIPMLNVYVNGEVVKTIIGAKPKPALLKELAEFI